MRDNIIMPQTLMIIPHIDSLGPQIGQESILSAKSKGKSLRKQDYPKQHSLRETKCGTGKSYDRPEVGSRTRNWIS